MTISDPTKPFAPLDNPGWLDRADIASPLSAAAMKAAVVALMRRDFVLDQAEVQEGTRWLSDVGNTAADAIDALPDPTPEAMLAEAMKLPQIRALETASDKLGAWVSAALDDPKVCEAMKDDINGWFAALAALGVKHD